MITYLLTVSFVGLLCVAGLSADCNIACPAVYRPVCANCGGEMKTFSNSCSMQTHNECNNARCKLQHNGQCNTNCNMACTRDFNPICAWNGRNLKTFSNKCGKDAFNRCYNDRYATIPNLSLIHI
ncbi:turripeptide Pal9.2-like [Cimex lectularius]|uniref:Kazal-like domain-containing protein n=1 Tax=Cimex lectularius TaxID=79782 RepID=A0A8I6SM40_CIMLE|nr:turripeptide Pal9.2-like [Cimex lectularius]